MTGIYHNVRQFFNGTSTLDARIKYMLLSVGIAVIHLIFTIAFGVNHIMPLFYYNAVVTFFYLYHSFVSIRKGRFMLVFITSVTEIIFCSTYTSLMLGWNWGFHMYTMALVPAAFYLTYTLQELDGKIVIPTIASTVASLSFILTRVVCGRVEPFYTGTGYADNLQICFYYFNIIISFFMSVLFSTMFAMEIRYMQTQLEQENRSLGEAANVDPLTHLLNRRSMNAQLKAMLDESGNSPQDFCIMLADIDDFKKVNDTYGHDCGDEVLISIANVIAHDVREEDAVCRWGGEEILIMLKADLAIAKKVAERICKDVRGVAVKHGEDYIGVTITIGIADYKKKQTIRSMIEEADRNMYYGKQHGKNQVVTSHDRVDDEMLF